MPKSWISFAVLAMMCGLFAGMSSASAEASGSVQATQEFAAQSRPRITIRPRIHPGPNSKRYCRAWLAKEYRVSGPVIVPQMRCWWQ
jgi:hypothetical protein